MGRLESRSITFTHLSPNRIVTAGTGKKMLTIFLAYRSQNE